MKPKSEKILLGIVFLFALAIRLAYIDQKNLWFDEVFSWHMSLSSFYEIIIRTTNDIHPPLYYFVLKIWSFVFGDSVFALRLLSALFTSSAIFFIFAICKRFMGFAESFLVLLLYTISPLNLYYSQEARMSAMNLLLNISAVHYYIRLTEPSKLSTGIFKNPVLYLFIFFEAAALYTHYFSFFILAAIILFTFIHFRNRLRDSLSVIYALAGIVLLYIPWIPALIEHLKRGQAWRQKQNFRQVSNELLNYLKDVSMGLYYHYADLKFVDVLTWVVLLLTLVMILLVFLNSHEQEALNLKMLIGMCFVVTILLASIISFNQKIEFYRYLSILVPYICIIAVFLFGKIKKKPISYSLITLMAMINCFGIYWHYTNDFKNDDYRQIIKEISTGYKEGDKIYVQPHYCGWIIDYTRKQENLKIPKFVDHRYGWNVLVDSIKNQDPHHFWLVMDYSDVDTSKYSEYIGQMRGSYIQSYYKNYPMAPARVELYRFDKPN